MPNADGSLTADEVFSVDSPARGAPAPSAPPAGQNYDQVFGHLDPVPQTTPVSIGNPSSPNLVGAIPNAPQSGIFNPNEKPVFNQTPVTPPNDKLANDVIDKMLSKSWDIGKSTVSKGMELLSLPVRMVRTQAVNALDTGGKEIEVLTGMNPTRGIGEKLNPEGYGRGPVDLMMDLATHQSPLRVNPGASAPESSYTDVADFLADKWTGTPAENYAKMLQGGYSSKFSQAVLAANLTARQLVGTAGDIVGDPLMWVSMGTEGPLAQMARKEGIYAEAKGVGMLHAESRNLIEFHVPKFATMGPGNPLKPLAGQTLGRVPISEVADVGRAATQAAGQAIAQVPGGELINRGVAVTADKVSKIVTNSTTAVGKVLRNFSPWTGHEPADQMLAVQSAKTRGAMATLLHDHVVPWHENKFSDAEKQAIVNMIEATDNIKPSNIPLALLQKAGPKIGTDAELVREDLGKALPAALKKAGIDRSSLPIGREDKLIEGAHMIKRLSTQTLELRHSAGLINAANIKNYVKPNYLARMADPKALAAERGAELQYGEKVGSNLSTYDPGRFKRKLPTPFAKAEAAKMAQPGIAEKMKAAGLKNYFYQDPMVATAMKNLKTQKYVRDSQFLRFLGAKYGHPLAEGAQTAPGYAKINHSEFDSTPFPRRDGKIGYLKGMQFPEEIASKVNYNFLKRDHGDLGGFMNGAMEVLQKGNKVFRSTALLSPGFWMRNMLDNAIKVFADGGSLPNLQKARNAVINQKQGMVELAGKQVSYDQIRSLLREYGVGENNQFKEGVNNLVNEGKAQIQERSRLGKMWDSKLNPWELARMMNRAGEHGENLTRAWHFIDRLDKGYTAGAAAYELERTLFDFGRNSQWTDYTRAMFFPFIQHAIKTAERLPGLIGQSPGTYNLLHNTIPRALNNTFHDPLTHDAILSQLPKWRQYQDPIIGPILPANGPLNGAFTKADPDNPRRLLMLRQSMGADILGQFAVWENGSMNSMRALNPLLAAAVSAFMLGKDLRTGKNIDLDPDDPHMATRVAAFVNNAINSEFALPGLRKGLEQALNMGELKSFDPLWITALNSGFSQFATVTNLDHEFMMKNMALTHLMKDLKSQAYSTFAREKSGASPETWLSDKPKMLGQAYRASQQENNPSNAMVMNMLTGKDAELKKDAATQKFINGQLSAAQLAGVYRNLDQQMKELHFNYSVGREMQLRGYKQANDKARLIKQMGGKLP